MPVLSEREHNVRTVLILGTFALVLVILIAASVLHAGESIVALLLGMASILSPAVIDTLRLKRKFVVRRLSMHPPPLVVDISETPTEPSIPPQT